jgi:hypothetical protein
MIFDENAFVLIAKGQHALEDAINDAHLVPRFARNQGSVPIIPRLWVTLRPASLAGCSAAT